MSEDNGNSLEGAKEKLQDRKEKINSSNPAKGEIPAFIQRLTPSEAAKKIKYFNRINTDVKNKFKEHGSRAAQPLKLKKEGPTGIGTEVGKIWHKSLEKAIDNPEDTDNAAISVIEALEKDEESVVKGITFLQTEFPLYGFIEDTETSEMSFWNGNADAIGLIEENGNFKYVIVEWKAVDLLQFWEKNRYAYGDYLHQCIVYAKLLQIHLKLGEPPKVLIVPINNKTGKDIDPVLFNQFPEECTNHLAKYTWFLEEPKTEKVIKSTMVKDTSIENLDTVKVKDLFKDETTVRDLLDALGLNFFELKIEN